MILNCPACKSRYLLPASALLPEGRRVKCTSCSEIWFQLPDPDELEQFAYDRNAADDETDSGSSDDFLSADTFGDYLADDDDDDDDDEGEEKDGQEDERSDDGSAQAREAARAVPRPKAQPHVPLRPVQDSLVRGRVMGGLVAMVVFILIGAGLYATRENVVRQWPIAATLYEMVGVRTQLHGEGLIFDKLNARLKKDDHGRNLVHIQGNIINLTSNDREIPIMEATLQGADGSMHGRWYIEPPQDLLKSEEAVTLDAAYPVEDEKAAEQADRVNLRFILAMTPKTAAEGDGNIQAHTADGPDHPTAHEAAGESHPPASSEPHQESSQDSASHSAGHH